MTSLKPGLCSVKQFQHYIFCDLSACGLLKTNVMIVFLYVSKSKCLCSRLSFYSGHSSFGMYCMLFLAVSVTVIRFFSLVNLTNGMSLRMRLFSDQWEIWGCVWKISLKDFHFIYEN